MSSLTGVSVVAVHAHPDDEALWTGGVLADLAHRGADVLVVTCTLGEQGEVIGQPFSGLVADRADQLGGFRIAELHASLKTLGVRGVFLGGVGYWRDSGMAGDASNEHPRAFMHSGFQAVEQLKNILRMNPAHLIITYGPDGGYGHPDHIRAHEITHQAVEQLELTTPIVWAVTDRDRMEEALRVIANPSSPGWRLPKREETIATTSTDADIEVRLSDWALSHKVQAMKAHPTQIWVADGSTNAVNPEAAYATVTDRDRAPFVFCLSNRITLPVLRYEHYQVGTPVSSEVQATIAALVAGELEAPKECE